MTERKVNLEQSLIAQEKELLNPPSDGPIPEVALYRALRMAELAILGELERLNSSHKLAGLQLEYKVVEISETEDDHRMEVLQQQAPVFSVRLGKLIEKEQPQKIEKYQNQNPPEEEQDSLNIEFIINLVDKLKEYLIEKSPQSNLLNNNIHLNLQLQLNSQLTTYQSCDRDCREKCGHKSPSETRRDVKRCFCHKPC
ncbi:MAG: hypothetical protein HEQ13_06530 [Dolichospermum sp. DEX189]|jgi:hypothetical protein|uniref:Uncharacterized protein n=1 Tax=Aphanizomenon flos-aquae FACHB-1040 TaxID=2692887 RepID=A0ABR8BW54_APHFL|nr:hypothetical protein [Aphanizomenon flos-aquae]MBD2279174.1 hypothetical protein [Aphanizomenon flos-aquae FACHB-1040]MBO1069042.1 hypothetical protein [Dolichospermum sp. DEX189]